MLSTTTSELAQPATNTDSLHWERTAEMQVSTRVLNWHLFLRSSTSNNRSCTPQYKLYNIECRPKHSRHMLLSLLCLFKKKGFQLTFESLIVSVSQSLKLHYKLVRHLLIPGFLCRSITLINTQLTPSLLPTAALSCSVKFHFYPAAITLPKPTD